MNVVRRYVRESVLYVVRKLFPNRGSSPKNFFGEIQWTGILLLVVVFWSTDPYTIQRALGVSVSGLNIYLGELVLLAILVMYTINVVYDSHVEIPRSAVPLLLFVGYFSFISVVSLLTNEVIDVVREMRGLVYYLLIFPLLSSVSSRSDCLKLIGAMVAGSLIGTALFVSAQFGYKPPGMAGVGRLTRQIVPGETFLVSLLILIPLAIVTRRGIISWAGSAILGILAFSLLMTGTESLFLVLFFVLPLLWLVSKRARLVDGGIITMGMAIFFTIILLLIFLKSTYLQKCVAGACVAASNDGISLIESFGIRVKEWYYWTQLWIERPIIGQGLGVRYQQFFTAPGRLVGGLSGSSTLFWLLAKMGIGGLVLYGWAWLGGLRTYCAAWHRNTDNKSRAILVGCAMSALAVGVFSLFHSQGVTDPTRVIIFLVLFSIVIAIGKNDAHDS